jgi:hypothetical protein
MANGMAQKSPVVIVVGVAMALRVLVPLFALAAATPRPQFREPDSEGYVRLATHWLENGCFGAPGEPEIVRTPGYPLLLLAGAAVHRLDAVTIALQIVLAGATVWLTHRTALHLRMTSAASLTAAWLYACEPISIIYASKILSETLFTTLLATVLWLIARYAQSRHWRDLMAAAVATAAAAYVRPIAYYLPGWIGLLLLVVFWRGDERPRRLVLQAVAFVVLAMSLLAPWQIRNHWQTGYAGFAAIADINLYYYEALPVLADARGLGPAEREHERIDAGSNALTVYLRRHPEQAGWSPARRYQFLRREAMAIIRAHPLDWSRLHFVGVFHTLSDSGRNAWLAFFGLADTAAPSKPAPPRPFWRRLATAATQRPLVLAIHALLAAILLTYLSLALVGLFGGVRTGGLFLVLGVTAYLLLLSGGDAGYHRFRVPLTPVICLLAAQGYGWLASRPLRQKWQGVDKKQVASRQSSDPKQLPTNYL